MGCCLEDDGQGGLASPRPPSMPSLRPARSTNPPLERPRCQPQSPLPPRSIVPQFIYIGLACWVGATAQMFFWTYTAVRQTNRIRLRYLSSVLRQEVGYFESESDPGKLMQGLNEDCVTIQAAIGDRMGRTLFNLFTAIIGIIVAFTRGWDMTLVMLAVTPLLILAGWLISTFLAKLTTRMNNAYGRA